MAFIIKRGRGECLCRRCDNGTVMERANGREYAWCHRAATAAAIPLDIVRCSDFSAKGEPSRYEMEKIAWTVTSDATGRICGFNPPEKDDG